MTPEMMQVLAVAFTAWGIAVAAKAINALRTGDPYTFSMWDGGMLRAGKRLTRFGMQLKIVSGSLMAAACFALVTHLLPLHTACYGIMFVGVFSVVADLVTGE